MIEKKHEPRNNYVLPLCQQRAKLMSNNSTPTFTYAQLFQLLLAMTPEQLSQQVQLLPPESNGANPVGLEPVLAMGTVEQFCHVSGEVGTETRSSLDWAHHPEAVVLLRDDHGFSEHGDSSYTMEMRDDDELYLVGNRSGIAQPVVEPEPGVPCVKVCRSQPMQPHPAPEWFASESTPELVARLEEWCLDDRPSMDIERLQAELYRRLFHLEPRDLEKPEAP